MSFVHPVQVRYLEVDQQGVVFNMWYLAWFDDAMTAFLAHIGAPHASLAERGLDVQLVRSEIDWRTGVGFGDQVRIEIEAEAVGTTSFTLGFRVLRGEEITARARIVYVVVALDRSGKRPVPDELRAALGLHDAGRPAR